MWQTRNVWVGVKFKCFSFKAGLSQKKLEIKISFFWIKAFHLKPFKLLWADTPLSKTTA